jgi:signal peptidase
MGVLYVLVHFRLPRVLAGGTNTYLAQPVAWTSLAVLAYLGWRFGLQRRPQPHAVLITLAAVTGLFQVSLTVIGGLLSGFGGSPYSRELAGIAGNLLYLGTMLVGWELSRAYLVAAFAQGNRTVAVVTVGLIFAVLAIPPARVAGVADGMSFFRFTGETLLPAFAENLLAAFLALLGGPLAAIAYRGVLLAFEWLSPVLPDVGWTAAAFIGTIAPAFGLIVIRNHLLIPERSTSEKAGSGQLSTGWVLAMALAVGLLWFNAGLFEVRPTLVSGVSMEPALRAGDIAITRDVPADEIRPGDIIRFQSEGKYVLHRVIEVEDGADSPIFLTQGDANNVTDPPVFAEELSGKVVLVVPKIGWLGIWVRQLLELFR